MSTHCFIGIRKSNGYIDGIYCHHDGYPEYVGTILTYKYTTEKKISDLLKLGNISVLGENVSPIDKTLPHTLINHQPRTVVAYYRDDGRREEGNMYKNLYLKDIADFDCRRIYIWDTSYKYWRTYKVNTDNGFMILEEYIDYSLYISNLVNNGYMTEVSKKLITMVKNKYLGKKNTKKC